MRMIVLIFTVLLIFIADFLLIVDHGKTFSPNENRILQQAPALTMSSLTSGKFMTQEESFVTDQFFMRDTWISMKLLLDRLSGKAESNGVYLGKQDYLIEKPSEPIQENMTRNIEAIKSFSAHYPDMNIVMTLVPTVAWVCDQLLPNQAPVIDVGAILTEVRNNLGSSVKFVDVTETLKKHKNEELYYKSDHHWKSLGAKYAFEAMTGELGIENMVRGYAVMTVTYDFSGTQASNSGATGVKDSIEIYVPLSGSPAELVMENDSQAEEAALNTELQYVVEYVDTTEKSATIYNSEALTQKDKYQVFLGGNHTQINIGTNVDNGKNLLILKDSYANTFIQFLLPYYHTITIVDPRYYSDDLGKLITDRGITDTLFLFCENFFVTDNTLFGVLEDMNTADVTADDTADDTAAQE